MKRGNLWMTVIGAGLVMAAMVAGRAATQSPTMLYLAGQFQVATGHTEKGIQLINQAASWRESGTVHAAEPAAGTTRTCTKTQPKSTQLKPAGAAKPVTVAVNLAPPATKTQPIAVIAKLEVPMPPMPPSTFDQTQGDFDSTAFRYLNEQRRADAIKAQVELQKSQFEKMKHLRHKTQVIIEKYAPAAMSFNPVDLSSLQQGLPSAVGQMAH